MHQHLSQCPWSGCTASVGIRPLRPEDAAEAAAVAGAALEQVYPETERRPRAEEAARVAAGTARVAHLQRTDPGGCWVAEVASQIVGVAIG